MSGSSTTSKPKEYFPLIKLEDCVSCFILVYVFGPLFLDPSCRAMCFLYFLCSIYTANDYNFCYTKNLSCHNHYLGYQSSFCHFLNKCFVCVINKMIRYTLGTGQHVVIFQHLLIGFGKHR